MGATGMRSKVASCTTSSVVRAEVHSRMVSAIESPAAMRPPMVASWGSLAHSGWPTSTVKSCHCWPVNTQNPT